MTNRERIDEVYHKNAMRFQDLGSDSEPWEYAEAGRLEAEALAHIRHLDPEYVDVALKGSA